VFIHESLTHEIVGSAIEVHKYWGLQFSKQVSWRTAGREITVSWGAAGPAVVQPPRPLAQCPTSVSRVMPAMPVCSI
jgi:hypothetical protein